MRKWILYCSAQLAIVCGLIVSIGTVAVSQQTVETAQQPGTNAKDSANATETQAAKESDPVAPQVEKSAEPAKSGLIDFNRDIRPIFAEKCIECHGPQKASNDYRVDQQESLFLYIEGGSLDSSPLWTDYLITDDEAMKMPPVKHDNPLTGAELALIKVWIEEGAQWREPAAQPATESSSDGAAQAVSEPAPTAPAAAPVPVTLQEKLWEFQGYFHPAMVHFPVALLIMAALFGVGSILFGETCELVAFHCLWVGALGAVASCFMGWSFADICGYGADPWAFDWNSAVTRHRWSGIVLASLSMLVWFVAIIARWTESTSLRNVWIVGALIAASLVGIVGHQGGEMTYGEGMYDKAFKNLLGENSQQSESGVQLPTV